MITHLVESPAAADPEVPPTPAPAPRARPQLAPPPVTAEVAVVEPVAEPTAEPVTDTVVEIPAAPVIPAAPTFMVHTPTPPSIPVTLSPDDPTPLAMPQPDTSYEVATALEQAEPNSQAEPHAEAESMADESAPVEEQPLAGLAPSAMEALMSGSIKDEVAEAVRRALASIDH